MTIGRLLRMTAGFALGCLAAFLVFGVALNQEPTKPNPTLTIQRVEIGNSMFTTLLELEYAETADERATGLMFRKSNAGSHGMLFPLDGTSPHFTMKNVHLPLDVLFVGPDMRVIEITKAEPLSEEPVVVPRKAIYALELPGDATMHLKMKVGDQVSFVGPPLGPKGS